MATNVTSLVRSEPKSANFWFQMLRLQLRDGGHREAASCLDVIHKTPHYKPARRPRHHPSCNLRAYPHPNPAGIGRGRTNFTSV